MDQPSSAIGFREVDRDGNTVGEDAARVAEDLSGAGIASAVNPFIVALWLLAGLLVGGGVWAFLNANFTTGPSSGSMPVSFVIFTFAPHAVLSGIIAVIGLLLWHAHQWQRRRG